MKTTIKISFSLLLIIVGTMISHAQTSPNKSRIPNGYHLLKKIGDVKVGKNPDAIIFDAATN